MTLSFFRRHKNLFMVLMFLSVLSMLLWGSWTYIGPKWEALFGSEGPRKVVGSIRGESVRAGELADFFADVRMAGQASEFWGATIQEKAAGSPSKMAQAYGLTLGMTAWPFLAATTSQERPERSAVLTWMALYREAREQGFDTSAAEVEARLEGLADAGLPADAIKRAVDQLAGGQRDRLVRALRTDMTLRTYINWLGETLSGTVEPELRKQFAQSDERIKVRLVVLKAADAIAEVGEVPEDVLRQHFEKYRKFLAGQSPEGYGYRIPDRVAVEYLVAEPAAFEDEAAAKVTDEAVRRYYDQNKDSRFVIDEKDEKKDESKADASGGAAAGEKKYRPFEEVRDQIRKDLLKEEARSLARERLHSDVAEIRSSKKVMDLRIWADGKCVKYVSVSGLHTAEELAAIKPLGQATRGNETLPDYALAVAELVGAAKAKLAVKEMSDVFTGPGGEALAFRVTEVQANHEPADLKEVRDKVLADVRRMRAFEKVRQRGRTILEAASAKGLEAAAKDAGVKSVESDWVPRERTIPVPYRGRMFSMPPSLPEIGANRAVVAECFRMAAENRQRTLVTLAEDQTVVIAELVGRKPPRQKAYEMQRPMLAMLVGRQLAEAALAKAIDLGAIQRRMTVIVQEAEETPRRDDQADGGSAEPTQ